MLIIIFPQKHATWYTSPATWHHTRDQCHVTSATWPWVAWCRAALRPVGWTQRVDTPTRPPAAWVLYSSALTPRPAMTLMKLCYRPGVTALSECHIVTRCDTPCVTQFVTQSVTQSYSLSNKHNIVHTIIQSVAKLHSLSHKRIVWQTVTHAQSVNQLYDYSLSFIL